MGMLALALVFALGSLGVAYAAWTDSIVVTGTVETGTVDIDIAGCSSTFVYKVPGAPDTGWGLETVYHYIYGNVDFPPPGGTLIASAVSTYSFDPDADIATMTFTNIFPCIDFKADVLLEYVGTVPAKIEFAAISADDPMDEVIQALWDLGEISKDGDPMTEGDGIWIDAYVSTDDGNNWTYYDDLFGIQLHQGDFVRIILHAHIPQITDEPGNPLDQSNIGDISLDFSGSVNVIQWNEFLE